MDRAQLNQWLIQEKLPDSWLWKARDVIAPEPASLDAIEELARNSSVPVYLLHNSLKNEKGVYWIHFSSARSNPSIASSLPAIPMTYRQGQIIIGLLLLSLFHLPQWLVSSRSVVEVVSISKLDSTLATYGSQGYDIASCSPVWDGNDWKCFVAFRKK
jgi:hypothetical protein